MPRIKAGDKICNPWDGFQRMMTVHKVCECGQPIFNKREKSCGWCRREEAQQENLRFMDSGTDPILYERGGIT